MWQPIAALSPVELWWGAGIAVSFVFVPMLIGLVCILLEAAKERRR